MRTNIWKRIGNVAVDTPNERHAARVSVEPSGPTIFTIGHGTRSMDDLVETLRAASILRLVDVRRFPGSRRNPQFGRDNIVHSLPASGIEYVFRGDELGGRRTSKKPSRHPALEDPGFRAYADSMDEPAFDNALVHLIDDAKNSPLALMCAETIWPHCHRRLIADALVLRGIPVVHLLSPVRNEPRCAKGKRGATSIDVSMSTMANGRVRSLFRLPMPLVVEAA